MNDTRELLRQLTPAIAEGAALHSVRRRVRGVRRRRRVGRSAVAIVCSIGVLWGFATFRRSDAPLRVRSTPDTTLPDSTTTIRTTAAPSTVPPTSTTTTTSQPPGGATAESVRASLAALDAKNASSPLIAYVSQGATSTDFMRMVDQAISECMAAAGYTYIARTAEQMSGVGDDPNQAVLQSLPEGKLGPYSIEQFRCQEVANSRMFVYNGLPDITGEIEVAFAADRRIVNVRAWIATCVDTPRLQQECEDEVGFADVQRLVVQDAERAFVEKHRDRLDAWRANWPKLPPATESTSTTLPAPLR
jgi:hypothetical protein